MAGWKVEVTGLRQLMDGLRQMDKAAAREIEKEITAAGKAVATNASYLVPGSNPISNWGSWNARGRDLGFDAGAAASGFKLRRSNFRRRGVSAGIGWDVYQTNAGAAIFEVIGSGSRVTTPSGAAMVAAISSRFPRKQPRTLIPAYYSVMSEKLRDQIRDRIVEAGRKAGLI